MLDTLTVTGCLLIPAVELTLRMCLIERYFNAVCRTPFALSPTKKVPQIGRLRGRFWQQGFDGETLLLHFEFMGGRQRPTTCCAKVIYTLTDEGTYHREAFWSPPFAGSMLLLPTVFGAWLAGPLFPVGLLVGLGVGFGLVVVPRVLYAGRIQAFAELEEAQQLLAVAKP